MQALDVDIDGMDNDMFISMVQASDNNNDK
jgi:hypothetical protein